jgi:hypothetical protein
MDKEFVRKERSVDAFTQEIINEIMIKTIFSTEISEDYYKYIGHIIIMKYSDGKDDLVLLESISNEVENLKKTYKKNSLTYQKLELILRDVKIIIGKKPKLERPILKNPKNIKDLYTSKEVLFILIVMLIHINIYLTRQQHRNRINTPQPQFINNLNWESKNPPN